MGGTGPRGGYGTGERQLEKSALLHALRSSRACACMQTLPGRHCLPAPRRYTCCNGDMPCSGRCGEQSCPEFCLCLEVGAPRWRHALAGLGRQAHGRPKAAGALGNASLD